MSLSTPHNGSEPIAGAFGESALEPGGKAGESLCADTGAAPVLTLLAVLKNALSGRIFGAFATGVLLALDGISNQIE